MKIGNRKCRGHVTRCEPFEGSHLAGIKMSATLYVVYSYGDWPIWACIDGKWYGHKSKYSNSTSIHTSNSEPNVNENKIVYLAGVDELRERIKTAKA